MTDAPYSFSTEMCCCWHNSPARTALLGGLSKLGQNYSKLWCPHHLLAKKGTSKLGQIYSKWWHPRHLLAKKLPSFSFSPTEADRFSCKPIQYLNCTVFMQPPKVQGEKFYCQSTPPQEINWIVSPLVHVDWTFWCGGICELVYLAVTVISCW